MNKSPAHQETIRKRIVPKPHAESLKPVRGRSSRQPQYLPTPKEIQDECRRIRESWSEEEHRKRAGYAQGRSTVKLRYVQMASLMRNADRW